MATMRAMVQIACFGALDLSCFYHQFVGCHETTFSGNLFFFGGFAICRIVSSIFVTAFVAVISALLQIFLPSGLAHLWGPAVAPRRVRPGQINHSPSCMNCCANSRSHSFTYIKESKNGPGTSISTRPFMPPACFGNFGLQDIIGNLLRGTMCLAQRVERAANTDGLFILGRGTCNLVTVRRAADAAADHAGEGMSV